MEFNSLLSKSAQKRIAEGEAPIDAVKAQPVAQPVAQPKPENDANSVSISELSTLSDEALERWLR